MLELLVRISTEVYNSASTSFVAGSGLDIFSENFQSCKGVFLAGWRSQKGEGFLM